MPLTPLHYCVAYLIYRATKIRGKKVLSFPPLMIGSFVPDLEIPVFYFLTGTMVQDRLVLHSLLGSVTIGLLITIFLTVYIYPPLLLRIGLKMGKIDFSPKLYLSAFIGVLGHVVLDALHHPYNPLFYPFTTRSIDYLIILGNTFLASQIVYLILTIITVLIILYELRRGIKDIWARILIGSD